MIGIVAVLAVAALACLSGPLFPFKPIPSDGQKAVTAAPDLDVFLRAEEGRHPEIKPGLAKGILWNDPVHKMKTPIALVHLHGFSASRKDISPVVETLAAQLHANAFFTRLAAHGLSSPVEFATVTPQDWLNDAREALAVGRRLGDRVILVGISTGALLATMAALEDKSDIAALVLLSPNFGLSDWRAQFISGPLGRWLARIAIGRDYSFEPATKEHAEFWTPRYPSQAVVALMDLLNYARTLRLGALGVPTLIIYTDKDEVVDVGAIRARFAEIGSPRKRLVNLPAATRHELTGDALAPDTVQPVIRQVSDFLSAAGVI
jgi:alpha-beta hydrolase superfamily lysophospholipase